MFSMKSLVRSTGIFIAMLMLLMTMGVEAQADENVLVVAKGTEAEGFDPHTVPAHSSIQIYNRVYDALLGISPEGDIQPELAKDWEIIDDTTYRFELREGVKFHNGREMTSADVKYSFERMVDPDLGSLAKTYFEMVEKVETPDDYTVIFHLEEPFADFLINVAHTYAKIVPQEVVEEEGDLMDVAVGTGAFKLTEWVPDNYTLLEANEDYYIEGLPRVDALRFLIMEDESAQIAAVRTGQVHITDLSPEGAQILRGRPGLEVVEYPSFDYTYWAFNVTEEPFDDPLVRKAMSYAIDREVIADIAFDGFADITGPVPPSQELWAVDISEYPSYQHNPDRARELLAEAGYGDGLEISITASPAYAYMVDTAVVIQEQLRGIGVDAEIDMVEWGAYIDAWINRDHMSMVGLNGGGLTPERALYFFFHTTGGANVWGFSDPEFDDLVERGRVEVDPDARYEIYAEAQKLLVNELAPNLFLNSPYSFYVIAEGVEGFEPTSYKSEGFFKHVTIDN